MRRLCLIIFVIPAAAAVGFDVPAVDLNWGRFPSHPPSASQPETAEITHSAGTHTFTLSPLAYTFEHPNTNTHTHRGVFFFLPQRKRPYAFLCICCQCSVLQTHTHAPLHSSQLRQSSVGYVEPLISRAFISVLSIWWGEGLHGLFGASLWADIKGCESTEKGINFYNLNWSSETAS